MTLSAVLLILRWCVMPSKSFLWLSSWLIKYTLLSFMIAQSCCTTCISPFLSMLTKLSSGSANGTATTRGRQCN